MNKKMNTFLGWLMSCTIILLYISPFFLPKYITSFELLTVIGVSITIFLIIVYSILGKLLNSNLVKIKTRYPDFFSKKFIIIFILLFTIFFIDICWSQYKFIYQGLHGIIFSPDMKRLYLRSYAGLPISAAMIFFYINFYKTIYINEKKQIIDDTAIQKSEK